MANNLNDALDDLARAQQRLADAQSELNSDNAKLAVAKKTEAALKVVISSLQAKIKSLLDRLAGHELGEEQRATLLNELAELERLLKEAQDRLVATQTDIAVLDATIPIDVNELTAAAAAFNLAVAEVAQQVALLHR